MKILVTGSTGFVGRNLMPLLIKEKHHVLEITRNEQKSQSLFGESTQKYQITDDQEALKLAIRQFNPEIAIHLAALLTSSDDYESMQKLLNSNLIFLCRILDALKESQLKLFVNTGTFAEYYNGNEVLDPAYLYAATKIASRTFVDYYSKTYKYKQITIVPYTIYGGQDSQKKIMDIIFDSIKSDVPTDLSPGNQILDFIHIDDVVNLYARVIDSVDSLPPKAAIQAGTGEGTSLKQLAIIIEEITGEKTNINWGGKSYRNSDVMYAVADISGLNKLLNWQPSISLKLGIEKYLIKKFN